MAGRFFMLNAVASKNKLKETVKLQQKKYREQTGLFIAEGSKILEEMLLKNVDIVEIFSLKELNNDKIKCPVFIVDEAEMKKISSTESVCELLVVAKKKTVDIKQFSKLNNIILLDSVSDPGNLGTIIRSASAFGVEGIILFGYCADLYSSKVIRSTAGNFFKIPVVSVNSVDELQKYFKNHVKIATALSKNNNITLKECAKINKRIIMFGSEASGLSYDLIKTADKNIRLEMRNSVDSLNLAVCASIIMYETAI